MDELTIEIEITEIENTSISDFFEKCHEFDTDKL